MNSEKTWKKIITCLTQEKIIKLPKGGEFRARSNTSSNEISVTPIVTGISRRINLLQWERFVEKYNEVEASGYDPLRSGHYAKVSFNSSYIVAILKICGKE